MNRCKGDSSASRWLSARRLGPVSGLWQRSRYPPPITSHHLETLGDSQAARLSAGASVLVSTWLLGPLTASAYWLAFEPPRAYVRWVEQRSACTRASATR